MGSDNPHEHLAAMHPSAAFPEPGVYEREYEYWPWGRVLRVVATWVERNAPDGATVIDYMCGTGYLLNEIACKRNDLRLHGCSLTRQMIEYGQQRYPHLTLRCQDALEYQPPDNPQVILCTAGIHHLPPDGQTAFISKVARELAPGGAFIVGEEVIRAKESRASRALAALELGVALISHAINAAAPNDVVRAAIDVLRNDVLLEGEWKQSLPELRGMISQHFRIEEIQHLWPDNDPSYGDVVLVCTRVRSQAESK